MFVYQNNKQFPKKKIQNSGLGVHNLGWKWVNLFYNCNLRIKNKVSCKGFTESISLTRSISITSVRIIFPELRWKLSRKAIGKVNSQEIVFPLSNFNNKCTNIVGFQSHHLSLSINTDVDICGECEKEMKK